MKKIIIKKISKKSRSLLKKKNKKRISDFKEESKKYWDQIKKNRENLYGGIYKSMREKGIDPNMPLTEYLKLKKKKKALKIVTKKKK